MASLSYADEHFAWQQRVKREIGSKNTFYDTRMRSSSLGMGTNAYKTGSSFNPSSTMRSTFYKEQKRYNNDGYNHAYAFGGKTHISKAAPAADNPLLQRPSTQGSYRSKASSRKSVGSPRGMQLKQAGPRRALNAEINRLDNEARPQGKVERFNEIVDFSRKSSAQSSRHPAHPQDVEGQIVTADPAAGEAEEAQETFDAPLENEEEELPEIDVISARPESVRSARTSQSQREYIEMLEKLLLEERERRMKVETQLKKKDQAN